MKTLNILSTFVNHLVWAIGCYTIVVYAQKHWPLVFEIITLILISIFGLQYLWCNVIQPFKAGLKGEEEKG